MASIFTFDHQPPRVNSPWQAAEDIKNRPAAERSVSDGDETVSSTELDRLEAEPQDGPIEYKLHLLLRPRRAYRSMSTTIRVSGSQQNKQGRGETKPAKQTSQPLASSNQSRQSRLEHLTTQLLWRLQQSSPYHTTARSDLIIPQLPEDNADLSTLENPRRLLPGLEESNGALYELGVADDGTFVGLTKDEMDESMATLKVMAASLGCRVEVQRMKAVGTCEWVDEANKSAPGPSRADLWVAEALISPILNSDIGKEEDENGQGAPRKGASTVEQLRVSLTGPTTSGKTSLLGTLSNGTLDNGRGSSRINLLKHQHEVASGRTSSVAQELIGYEGSDICNYAVDNINIWPDIHDRAGKGRIVFFLDSAGHPRYQRTTLRALVGWAPSWTLLCIAANEGESASSAHSLSGIGSSDKPSDGGIGYMDLALAHLDLCLRLEIPFAIIITKSDLVQRARLKEMLATVFTKVKAAGRLPKLLLPTGRVADDLVRLDEQDLRRVQDEIITPLSESQNMLSIVPVILTSAVKGTGIGLTHALLRSLPIPPPPTAQDFTQGYLNPEQPAALFHIDEVYELPLSRAHSIQGSRFSDRAPVLTGYLRFGKLSIGDKIIVGPFPGEEDDSASRDMVPRDHPSPGYGFSLPDPLSAEFARLNARSSTSRASAVDGEWQEATIVNIRNLRLPVRTIEAGQAASVQIALEEKEAEATDQDSVFERSRISTAGGPPRIRKGQVLAVPSEHMLATGLTLQAATGFAALFRSPDIKALAVGSMVNVHVGMIRAPARVLRVAKYRAAEENGGGGGVFAAGGRQEEDYHDDGDVFGMADHHLEELGRSKSETDLSDYKTEYRVSLELLTNKEWIELGSRVFLVEGGSTKDKSGLEGYVGRVEEVIE